MHQVERRVGVGKPIHGFRFSDAKQSGVGSTPRSSVPAAVDAPCIKASVSKFVDMTSTTTAKVEHLIGRFEPPSVVAKNRDRQINDLLIRRKGLFMPLHGSSVSSSSAFPDRSIWCGKDGLIQALISSDHLAQRELRSHTLSCRGSHRLSS